VIASPATPAPNEQAAGESAVAAAVTPAPVSPSPIAPADVPNEPQREAVVEPQQTPAVVAAPPRIDAVPAPATTPEPPPSGNAVAVAPPTVRERVGTWAKGEVDEFRDGVKREIREFSSGYEKVRGFFRR
jgi:hypothetical protein